MGASWAFGIGLRGWAELNAELGAAEQAGFHGAPDVIRNRDPVPNPVLANECNAPHKDRRAIHELAGFVDRQRRLAVQPQLPLEQSHALLSGAELEDVDAAAGLLHRTEETE